MNLGEKARMAKYITIRELAEQLSISAEELVLKLREMGIQVIDPSDTIESRKTEQIKNFLKEREARHESVEVKEIVRQDGKVVIRRRRKKEEQETPAKVEETAVAEVKPETEAEAVLEEPTPEPVVTQEQKVEPALVFEEKTPVESVGEVRAEGVKPPAPEAEGAVSPVEEKPSEEEVKPELDREPKRERPKKRVDERPERKRPIKRLPIRGVTEEPAKVIARPEQQPPQPMPQKPKPAFVATPISQRRVIEIVSERTRATEETTQEIGRMPPPGFRMDYQDRRELRQAKKLLKREPKERVVKPAVPKVRRPLKIHGEITVGSLAKEMGVKASELIKKLLELDVVATINKPIDFDTASLIASEFGFEVESAEVSEKDILVEEEDKLEDLVPRPPVVTVMGHVDHGKTTLLDAIRKTNVAEHEVGGITQYIGASVVEHNNKKITFIDTPGHEAFTAMRARGAQVTDIVVLVVAADDGVMPQTQEAINHARAANVPIVVAINKIDKPNTNPDVVKKQLAENGLVPEEWGGDTLFAYVSAKFNKGIKELLDMILLQAEVLDLKANPKRRGKGYILESKMERGRGPVATVLVKNGVLKVGDVVVAGLVMGRIKAMYDSTNKPVKEAGPSMPVEVIGMDGLPEAGELLEVVPDEKIAKQIIELRQKRISVAETKRVASLEDVYAQIQAGEVKELNLIIKADVQGSLEALKKAISEIATEEVKTKIIHSQVGMITEADVNLALASSAIIIGFNVRPDAKALKLAKQEKIEIKLYSIIYDVIDDIKKALAGMLAPKLEEEILGRLEVRQTFRIPKVGIIAGCYVKDGKIVRTARARLIRDGVVVADTRIASLRRFKDDVKEVLAGYECGVGLENYQDIKVGDEIEVYEVREIRPVV